MPLRCCAWQVFAALAHVDKLHAGNIPPTSQLTVHTRHSKSGANSTPLTGNPQLPVTCCSPSMGERRQVLVLKSAQYHSPWWVQLHAGQYKSLLGVRVQ